MPTTSNVKRGLIIPNGDAGTHTSLLEVGWAVRMSVARSGVWSLSGPVVVVTGVVQVYLGQLVPQRHYFRARIHLNRATNGRYGAQSTISDHVSTQE